MKTHTRPAEHGVMTSERRTPRILVIEDDGDTRRALGFRLRAEGYETLFAMDALGGVQVALTEHPDLILLDLGLPAGGGYLVLERLSQVAGAPQIPVIVVSAREPARERATAIRAGARTYLQKPVRNNALRLAIRHALMDLD